MGVDAARCTGKASGWATIRPLPTFAVRHGGVRDCEEVNIWMVCCGDLRGSVEHIRERRVHIGLWGRDVVDKEGVGSVSRGGGTGAHPFNDARRPKRTLVVGYLPK